MSLLQISELMEIEQVCFCSFQIFSVIRLLKGKKSTGARREPFGQANSEHRRKFADFC